MSIANATAVTSATSRHVLPFSEIRRGLPRCAAYDYALFKSAARFQVPLCSLAAWREASRRNSQEGMAAQRSCTPEIVNPSSPKSSLRDSPLRNCRACIKRLISGSRAVAYRLCDRFRAAGRVKSKIRRACLR